jgi:hypothetical protein
MQEDEKASPEFIKALHGTGPKLTFWPLVALIYFEVSSRIQFFSLMDHS